ncbi:hypothetical protein [Pedobacter sp. Hv1]|uniref:hypothetical protein n=1 Tax=Pedobacter sp. Hv1 TaxID=1740090 RepID=UPI0006D8BDB6|nr:hypothetical protein [Pedobacter sp. Hv1]KQC02083.1 hypothetical protein AQF98_00480 [Pedobacter sp. Hv1]
MSFLTKKETAMISAVNASNSMLLDQRKELIENIKYNARLRSDGYRRPVKIFLSVLSNLKNNAIAADLLK